MQRHADVLAFLQKILGTRPLAWAVFLSGLVLLSVHLWHDVSVFKYDAEVYWLMAILPDAVPIEYMIRGYFFPWVMGRIAYFFYHLGFNPLAAFKAYSSVVFALGLGLLLPVTYRRLADGQVSWLRSLLLVLVVVAVYPGLIIYPLSDLPAILLMWLGIYWVLCCRDHPPSDAYWIRMVYALAAGVALGAAYNTRTIFLFAICLVVLAVVLQFHQRRHFLIYMAIGLALSCIPQVLMNQKIHGITSANPAVAFASQNVSLFAQQLAWGVTVQRYETAIGPDQSGREPSRPGLIYADPDGVQLTKDIAVAAYPLANGLTTASSAVTNVSDYLKIVLKHPVDFAALYVRHFVNGLDVRDGTVYVRESSPDKKITSLACITLVLLSLLSIKAGRADRNTLVTTTPLTPAQFKPVRHSYLLTGALVIASLAVVPGAMETRFMLALLLYLWVAGIGHASWGSIAAELRRYGWIYFGIAVVVYPSFYFITENTMESLQTPWMRNQF